MKQSTTENEKRGGSGRPIYHLVGKPICARGFQKLLGLGSGRFDGLKKALKNGWEAPWDGRFVQRTRLNLISKKHASKRASVVEFLEELLQTVSEPMPEAWKKQVDVPKEMRLRKPKGRKPMRLVAQRASQGKDTSGMRLLPPGTFSEYLHLLNSRLTFEERVTLKTFNSVPSHESIFWLFFICVY